LPDRNHPIHAEWIGLDDENEHLLEHGISFREINQVFDNSPIYRRNLNKYKDRWLMIGRTKGNRAIVCSVEYDEVTRKVIPINARECTKQEKEKWRI